MDEMLALLPTGARSDDTIFLALFLLRLPTSIRDHLAAADHKTAADMARHADSIWDSRAGETAVATVAAPVDAVAARSPARDSRRRSPDRRQQGCQRQQRTRLRDRIAAETSHSATTAAGLARRRTSVRHPGPGRKTRLLPRASSRPLAA
jgi:hypothetical protein